MACGFDPAQFWALTPRLLSLHVAGARDRFIREHNERMSVAWHTASLSAYAYHQPKKLPKLETLLHSDASKAPREQTAAEQIAIFKGILAGRRK